MYSKRIYRILLSFLSGILIGLSIRFANPALGLVSLIPLLHIILKKGKSWKDSMLYGFISGIGLAIWISIWLIDGLAVFIEGGSWIGWVGFILVSLCVCIHFAFFGGMIFFSSKITSGRYLPGLCIASSMVILESVFYLIFNTFPLFQPYLCFTQFNNLWLLQHSEWGGYKIVTLFVVYINYLLYIMINDYKSIKVMISGIGIILILHLSGWLILWQFEKNADVSDWSAKVATISPNISPKDQWNEKTGDRLMSRLLNANAQVLKYNPDIVLWTEGVVPWDFRADDDFIMTIRQMNENRDIVHFVGMETESDGRKLNSCYILDFANDTNNIFKKYDKRYLISFAETPVYLFGQEISFSRSSRYKPGSNNQSFFNVKNSKIATVICNENLIPASITSIVKDNDIELLVIIANNAWISQSSLSVISHFYISKFRAIENRVNIVMNSNLGLSGYINSKGESIINDNNIYNITHQKYYTNKNTFYNNAPYLTDIVAVIIFFVFIFCYIYNIILIKT